MQVGVGSGFWFSGTQKGERTGGMFRIVKKCEKKSRRLSTIFAHGKERQTGTTFGKFQNLSETARRELKSNFRFLRRDNWGGRRRNHSKTAVFLGKCHDNKISNVKIILSKMFVVIAQVPNKA